jgi:hypothetical protein
VKRPTRRGGNANQAVTEDWVERRNDAVIRLTQAKHYREAVKCGLKTLAVIEARLGKGHPFSSRVHDFIGLAYLD